MPTDPSSGPQSRKGSKRMLIVIMPLVLAAAAAAFLLMSREEAATGPEPSRAAGEKIAPDEVVALRGAGEKFVLLDVRTPEEHAAKRIPGSLLLPVEPVDEVTPMAKTFIPNKKTMIVVYCRSGRRSADAAKILVGLGYSNVRDLGGINDWPFETESGPDAGK